jgi:hypothetical protein
METPEEFRKQVLADVKANLKAKGVVHEGNEALMDKCMQDLLSDLREADKKKTLEG